MDLVAHVCESRRRLLAHLGVTELGPPAGAGAWAVVYRVDCNSVVKFQRMRGIRTDDPLVPCAPGRDDPAECAAQASMCPSEFSVASAVQRTWDELAMLDYLAHTRAAPRLVDCSVALAQSALAVPMEYLGAPLADSVFSLPVVLLISDSLYVLLDRLGRAGAVHGDIHAGQVYWIANERRAVLGDWGPSRKTATTHADDRAAVARLVQLLVRAASSSETRTSVDSSSARSMLTA